MDTEQRNGFRILLAVGALLTIGLGLWGIFAAGWLHWVFAFDVDRDAAGYVGLARLLGGAMLALGVGYLLAAAHPMRNRGLLVVGFFAPLFAAVTLIVATANEEVGRINGGLAAAGALAYCLLYFRLYPKPVRTLIPGRDDPDDGPGGPQPEEST